MRETKIEIVSDSPRQKLYSATVEGVAVTVLATRDLALPDGEGGIAYNWQVRGKLVIGDNILAVVFSKVDSKVGLKDVVDLEDAAMRVARETYDKALERAGEIAYAFGMMKLMNTNSFQRLMDQKTTEITRRALKGHRLNREKEQAPLEIAPSDDPAPNKDVTR
jgi:hypothetical protein